MDIKFLCTHIVTNNNPEERFADSVLLQPLHRLLKAYYDPRYIRYFDVDLDQKRVKEMVISDKPIQSVAWRIVDLVASFFEALLFTIPGILLKYAAQIHRANRERNYLVKEWIKPEAEEARRRHEQAEEKRIRNHEEAAKKLIQDIKPSETELKKRVHTVLIPTLLVKSFSNYITAREVANITLVCRNWHYIVHHKTPMDRLWRLSHPTSKNHGATALLKWHPNRTLQGMETIQKEIDDFYDAVLGLFGGKEEINKLYLVPQTDQIKSLFDVFKQMANHAVVQFELRKEKGVVVYNTTEHADNWWINRNLFTQEELTKARRLWNGLEELWKKKQEMLKDNLDCPFLITLGSHQVFRLKP